MRSSICVAVLATMLLSGCGGGSANSGGSSPNFFPNLAAGAPPSVAASPSAAPTSSATAVPVRPSFGPYSFQIVVPQSATPNTYGQFSTNVNVPGLGTLALTLPTANQSTTITATIRDRLPPGQNLPDIASSSYPGDVIADIAFQVSASTIFDGNYLVTISPVSTYYQSLGQYFVVELYYPGSFSWFIPDLQQSALTIDSNQLQLDVFNLVTAMQQNVTVHAAIVHSRKAVPL